MFHGRRYYESVDNESLLKLHLKTYEKLNSGIKIFILKIYVLKFYVMAVLIKFDYENTPIF